MDYDIHQITIKGNKIPQPVEIAVVVNISSKGNLLFGKQPSNKKSIMPTMEHIS